MKVQYLMLLGLFWSSLTFASEPKEMPSPVDQLFVPEGFDDNDNVEIILKGQFTSSCYRVGHTQSKVDLNKNLITVYGSSYYYKDGTACAQMVSPFIQVVKIGLLPAGTYKIEYGHQPSVSQSLYVSSRKTEDPDDYLYAPVEFADAYTDAQSGETVLEIQGVYPRMLVGCAVFREVRFLPSSDNLLIVLPIMEEVQGAACANQPHHFRKIYPMGSLLSGDMLLHVRVISGNSVNRYVSIRDR